ncbi:ABC transporter permease [Gulosibacter hominis]|uniref:ABC transporter permease n=1 Tax=Gulosibacter hominis TaxID=2770504 RepID=UPI001917CA67|nr:ABC transporter permease [Gulosibacter hominis]
MDYINEMEQQAISRAQRLQSLEFETREPTRNPFKGFINSVRELARRRELLGLLVRRELVGRYKDSVLGFTWTLIRPLTQLLIYYLVMGEFLGAARSVPNFAVYIFTGLTLWGLFSEIIQSMTGSIVTNAALVKKVHLPREIFPISTIGSALFNFTMQMVILLIAAGVLGTLSFGLHLLYAVVALLIVLAWGTCLGLTLAATNVYLRDVQYLVEVLLLLLMWFSPIVYSWQMVHQVLMGNGLETLNTIYVSNPVTLAILGFQAAFWAPGSGLEAAYPGGYFPDSLMTNMLIALAVGVIGIWFSQRIFARLQGNFAQEL